MKQKKNIDQLFKERFADHQQAPGAHVWDQIQARLEKQKRNRGIIIWWRTAGVAATLALLLSLAGLLGDSQKNSIVEQQNDVQKQTNTAPKIDKTIEVPLPKYKTVISATNKDSQSKRDTPRPKARDNKTVKKETLSVKNKEIAVSNTSGNKIATVSSKNLTVAAVASKEAPIVKENKAPSTNSVIVPPSNAIANTKTEKTGDPLPKKQSIFEAIEEQKQLESNQAVATKKDQNNPWEIAPNIAPVYFNTLSQGSSIDASFADNAQKGDVNISYGIGIRYALSDRLKIRSGINNVALSYSTSDIELGDGPVSAALRNIDYNNDGIVVIAQDLGTFANQNQDGTFGEITPKSTNGEAFISQNISYYEVPLELSYTLFDSTFGLDVIGGFSTLVLGDNQVSVTAGSYSELLGAANNLASISFASNIGLGLHYKMSSRFKINVEPMFKYQLNPYTDSSVSYKPFYLGIYSGLSFRF